MKKIVSLLIIAGLIFSAVPAFADGITVTVNGNKLNFDSEPIVQNDRLLVPMRAIFEALGADVSWDDSAKTAAAVSGGNTLKITVGDDVLYKNGGKIALDVPAVIQNSRTLVPIRAVSEGLGADVEWISDTKSVIITMNEKVYGFGEIDEADLEKFKEDKSAKITFETIDLPGETAKYGADFADDIKNNPENVKKYINDVWSHCQAEALLRIMIDSAAEYSVGEGIAEQLQSIIADAGKDAESQFEINIDGDVLVISFKHAETDTADFIGIKAENENVRFFAAYGESGKTVIYEIKSGIKEKFSELPKNTSAEDFKKEIE